MRGVPIGGGAPVAIQSMTSTKTADVGATVAQIHRLMRAGCAIVRVGIPDKESSAAFAQIRKKTDAPLVADIHFQYRFALDAIKAGADKVRINPGNIGSVERVRAVVEAAKKAGIPLRIGVNAGSLEKRLLARYGGPTPEALAQSACGYVAMMERFDFDDFVLSIKASDVLTTVNACRLLAKQCQYPQHIGITESGTARGGTIRSSVGLGILLSEGIGDTIRVSLCADPVEEVFVAKEILKSLDLASGPVVIACPTCSRTGIDVVSLAKKVETMVATMTVPIKIAVMGCIVNGPGEARESDVGITGGKGRGIIFRRGKEVERVLEADLLDTLWKHIREIVAEKGKS